VCFLDFSFYILFGGFVIDIPTKEDDNLLSTPKQKAAALNRQYQSIFTEEPPGDIPTKEDGLITPMANILFTKEGVEKLLKNLDPTKASGPDFLNIAVIFAFLQSFGTCPVSYECCNIIAKHGATSVAVSFRILVEINT
jgi:hypothetical protein